MLRVITACGSGIGSSQIIQMKLDKVFAKLNIEAEILHTNVAEAKSKAPEYDVLICPESLSDTFKGINVVIIALRNLLSEKEMTDKVQKQIIDAGLK